MLIKVIFGREVVHADDADRPELGNLGLVALISVTDTTLFVEVRLEVNKRRRINYMYYV